MADKVIEEHTFSISAHVEDSKLVVSFTRKANNKEEATESLLKLFPDLVIDEVIQVT